MECHNSKINFMEKMTQKELEEAFIDPKIGKTYKHFKGEEYLVVDRIPDGENDGEITIVYQNVRTHQRFTRSLSSWKSMAQVPRFTEVLDTQDNKAWISATSDEIEENLKAREIAFQAAMEELAKSAFPDVPEFKTLKGDGLHLRDFGLKDICSHNKDDRAFAAELPLEDLQTAPTTVEISTNLKNSQRSFTRALGVLNRGLKRNATFQNYIRKEIISAKVLEEADSDDFGGSMEGGEVCSLLGPKQKGGEVVTHLGVIGRDYLLMGEGWIKVMNKEKFEAKYKLEVPF